MNSPTGHWLANPSSRLRRILGVAWRWAEHALAVIGFVAIAYHSCFQVSIITSTSMAPTLQGTGKNDGDVVITEKFSYFFRRPRRWEVVTFYHPEHGQVMKRVVGLPGEKFQMQRGGKIFINGTALVQPPALAFLKYLAAGNVSEDKIVDCGDGYYVLGDHSHDSDDSRFNGPFSPSDVRGRAWLVISPRHRVGFIPQ